MKYYVEKMPITITMQITGSELYSSGIWHLDGEERFSSFKTLSEELRLKFGQGLPGRVYESGKPAWIVDVVEDPNFPRAETAALVNLHSGLAFPAMIANEVVAVIEFFTFEKFQPDEELMDLFWRIGEQLGRSVERGRRQHVSLAAPA